MSSQTNYTPVLGLGDRTTHLGRRLNVDEVIWRRVRWHDDAGRTGRRVGGPGRPPRETPTRAVLSV